MPPFHAQPNARAEVFLTGFEQADYQGVLLRIPGGLPGERMVVRLLERQGKQWLCRVEDRLTTAPERRTPPCPIWRADCACPLMIWNDDAQAEYKRSLVADALGVEVPPIVRAEQPLGYRSKVVLVARNGKLGAYRRGSHAFGDLDGCVIEEPAIAHAVKVMRRLLADVSSFDDRTGKGDLRYVVLRATSSGEVLVTWIGARPPLYAQALMEQAPQVKGVSFAENTRPGNAIWDKPPELLAGAPHVVEHTDGLDFQVSPQSFFQVHRAQAARLRAALELEGHIWDLYCGVGVNALSLAKRGHSVHGIERVEAAVNDARDNAKRNGLRATFSVANLDDPTAPLPAERPDSVVLNPPRKGAPLHLLERIVALRPKTIAYIACAPKPVGAALALFKSKGYSIDRVQPYDLFPHTEHVETLAIVKIA